MVIGRPRAEKICFFSPSQDRIEGSKLRLLSLRENDLPRPRKVEKVCCNRVLTEKTFCPLQFRTDSCTSAPTMQSSDL